VNGKIEPIYPANVFMRAVYLNKGRHAVIMKFEPESFSYGALSSAIAAAIYVFTFMLAIARYWNDRKKSIVKPEKF